MSVARAALSRPRRQSHATLDGVFPRINSEQQRSSRDWTLSTLWLGFQRIALDWTGLRAVRTGVLGMPPPPQPQRGSRQPSQRTRRAPEDGLTQERRGTGPSGSHWLCALGPRVPGGGVVEASLPAGAPHRGPRSFWPLSPSHPRGAWTPKMSSSLTPSWTLLLRYGLLAGNSS